MTYRMRVERGKYVHIVRCPKCGVVGTNEIVSAACDIARRHARVPHEGIAAWIEPGVMKL